MSIIYNQPSETQPCNTEVGLFIELKLFAKAKAEIWR